MPAIKERLDAFNSRGIIPTLRAMFYALVSLQVLHNLQLQYQYLSHFTARAREKGELPISCFADQSRRIIEDFDDRNETLNEYIERGINHLENAVDSYPKTIPRWQGQPHYVEVWVEKDALTGTFQAVLGDRQVRIVPIRGFSSVSFNYENIMRLKAIQREGKEIHIIYFGDLDPSGEIIGENINNKFVQYGLFDVDFQRVAVTEDQMNRYNLPRNPDPETLRKLRRDSRARSFLNRHGELFQIEVDALQAYAPDEFSGLAQRSVDQFFDEEIHGQIVSEYSSVTIDGLVKKSLKSLLKRL